MRLRAATNRDLGRIRKIVYTILEEYGFQSDPTGTDADLNDVEASYFRPGGAFDVIEDQAGAVVGTMGLLPLRDGVVELRKMYLVKELRGQGVGRKMMEHTLTRAKELGFRRIELETASVLVEAIAMYKRFGFQPIEQANLTDRCDRVMALDL